jgi:RNA-directed DNA polymerase
LVLDLDLSGYFDNIRHHILFEKVARRVQDDRVMALLKKICKAAGRKGVPQGGVVSPLLSNIYLHEVDVMMERAREVTHAGGYDHLTYVRYADDMVVLIDTHPRWDKGRWLLRVVRQRLNEELAKLEVKVNEEKTHEVNVGGGGSFSFLGYDFRWVKNRRGTKYMVLQTPRGTKMNAIREKVRRTLWQTHYRPLVDVIAKLNAQLRGFVNYFQWGNSTRAFQQLREYVERRIRRLLQRRHGRPGYGWKRWSTGFIYEVLGLFNGYRVVSLRPGKRSHLVLPHNPWCVEAD